MKKFVKMFSTSSALSDTCNLKIEAYTVIVIVKHNCLRIKAHCYEGVVNKMIT